MNLIMSFLCCFSSSEKGTEISDLNGDLNPDLCDASAVLYQLSYQAVPCLGLNCSIRI